MELKFWKKVVVEKNFPERMSKRASKLATPDLPLWLEQSLSETNRSLTAYQKSGDHTHLHDLLMAAEVVNCLASELYNRSML
jgi:hypothetical protein